MKTAKDIIDFVGRDRACAAVGRAWNTVRMAVIHNQLPAQWYDVLEHLAGRPLPREPFTFIRRKDE